MSLNIKIHRKFLAYCIKNKTAQIQIVKNDYNVSYETFATLATNKGILL